MSLFDELWEQYKADPNRRAFDGFDEWLVDQLQQVRTDRNCLFAANSEFAEEVRQLRALLAEKEQS